MSAKHEYSGKLSLTFGLGESEPEPEESKAPTIAPELPHMEHWGVPGYDKHALITQYGRTVGGLSWKVVGGKDGELHMAFVSDAKGYFSVGFCSRQRKMLDADSIWGWSDEGFGGVGAWYMPSYTASVIQRSEKHSNYLLSASTEIVDGNIITRFVRRMKKWDGQNDVTLSESGPVHMIWASRKTWEFETHDARGDMTLDLSKTYAQYVEPPTSAPTPSLELLGLFGVKDFSNYEPIYNSKGEMVMGLSWSIIGSKTLAMAFKTKGMAWAAVGFAQKLNHMIGADAIIGFRSSGDVIAVKLNQRDAAMILFDEKPRGYLEDSKLEVDGEW